MLLVGMIGRVRDCTVTGMLQAAGLAGEWHHSRAHDFFARARWNPDELGVALLDFLVTVFVKPDAPIRLAVDDTLFGRSGRKVWAAHYVNHQLLNRTFAHASLTVTYYPDLSAHDEERRLSAVAGLDAAR